MTITAAHFPVNAARSPLIELVIASSSSEILRRSPCRYFLHRRDVISMDAAQLRADLAVPQRRRL